MDASRTESIKRVFVVTPDDLSGVNKAVHNFLRANATVTYELACVDGMVRQLMDIRTLQEYDNPRDKAIKRIEISGHSEDFKRRCSITLSNDDFWANVRITATGGEGAVETFFESIQHRLIAMTPWYGRLARLNFIAIIFFIFFLLSVGATVLGIVYQVYTGTFSLERTLTIRGHVWITVILVFFLGGIFGDFLNRIRGRMFPLFAFAIGQGAKQYQEHDWWRRFFVGSVLIGSIIVGGLVGLIVNLLT